MDKNILEEVLRNKSDSLLVEVSKNSEHQRAEFKISSVLLFDSFDGFVSWSNYLNFQPNPADKKRNT